MKKETSSGNVRTSSNVHDDLRPSTTNFFISVFLFKILPYSLLDFGPAVDSATYNYPWENTG